MSELTERWDQLALLHAQALPDAHAESLRASLTDKDKLFLASLDKVQESLREYGKVQVSQPPTDVFERINATLLSQQYAPLHHQGLTNGTTVPGQLSDAGKIVVPDHAIPTQKAKGTIFPIFTIKQPTILRKKGFASLSLAACCAAILGFIIFQSGTASQKKELSPTAQASAPNSEIFNFDNSNNNASDKDATFDQVQKAQAYKCLIGLGYPVTAEHNIISVSHDEHTATILVHTTRENKTVTMAVTVSSKCLVDPHHQYDYHENEIQGRTHN